MLGNKSIHDQVASFYLSSAGNVTCLLLELWMQLYTSAMAGWAGRQLQAGIMTFRERCRASRRY